MDNADFESLDEVAEPEVAGTTLEQAAKLLAKLAAPVPKDFERMRAAPAAPRGPRGREMLLKEYLACVTNNPKEWLTTLPDTWMSPSALIKGKAVLGALEKVCKDCTDIYPEAWTDMKEAVAAMDTKMLQEEVDRRKAAKASQSTVDSVSESVGELERRETSDDEPWRRRMRRICINYCHLTANTLAKDLLEHAWEEGTKLESMETLQRIYEMISSDSPLHSVLNVIVAAQTR